MALIQSTAIPSGATDYELEQSLKFEDTAKNGTGGYLTKTPTSAGNSDLWTYSCWAKGLPAPNTNSHQTQILLGVDGDDSNDYYLWLSISNDGTFDFRQISASGYDFRKISTALYRDPSSWYHFVVAYDSANGTAEDRIKMYVNGERITSFGTNANPSSGQDAFVNKTKIHTIGRFAYNGEVQGGALNGYLAEVNLIDGQALTAADFGETGTYGEWKPIEYSGTYGTNGFYLNFAGGGIMSATGGTITTDGDYKVHSFTSDGTFTPTSISNGGEVEYLVVAGGGGGGGNVGGGGGAGGYRTGYLAVTEQAYSITVGAGGSGGGVNGGGAAGSNSVFSSITSIGGGGGGGYGSNAGNGGSGGGAGSGSIGTGTSGQGNNGGTGYYSGGSNLAGGGGGGAGAVGANGSSGAGGNGGNGSASSITGSSVTYAGGGGGRGSSSQGSGGSGGGGAGAASGTGTVGTANTGGGGGVGSTGGAGGSGIVIIRYKFQ